MSELKNRIFLKPTVGATEGRWYDMDVKPCPRCAFHEHTVQIEGDHVYYVVCISCRARGPIADDVFEAVALWNNRPIEAALTAQLAEANATIELLDSATVEAAQEVMAQLAAANERIAELEGNLRGAIQATAYVRKDRDRLAALKGGE